MSCIKYLLFAFNLIFVIFGILLIYSGIHSAIKLREYELIIKDGPNGSAIILCIIGFVIFGIAFLGCCGAIKENYCMLMSFGVIITLLLLVEIVGASIVLVFRGKLHNAIGQGLNDVVEKYESDKDLRKLMNALQHDLKCCGSNNSLDWNNTGNKSSEFYPSGKFPYSCCSSDDRSHDDKKYEDGYCEPSKVYHDGCYDALEKLVRNSFGLLGGIAIAIAVIQLFGIIFACCLSRTIKKEYEVV